MAPHRMPPQPGRYARDLPLRPTLAFLMLILVAASASRFYNLTFHSLWSDELWGVVASSQGSWYNMLHNLVFEDSHPPGYQTLLYVWMLVFGSSDAAVRLPTALAGIAAVMWTYRLGRQHFSVITGLVAATIASGSFHAIYYSQEARAYAFLLLLAPACTDLFLDLFLRQHIRRHTLPLFWLVSTCMIYMHYVGFVFFVGMVLLWAVLWQQAGRNPAGRTQAVRAFLPPLLLYLPWLPVMYYHMVYAPEAWSTPEPDRWRVWQTFRFLLGPDAARPPVLLLLLAGGAALGLLRRLVPPTGNAAISHATYTRRAFACLAWLALLPIVVFLVKSLISQSVYTYRHFTYAIPLLAVMCAGLPAFALQQVRDRQRRIVAVASCLLLLFALDMWGNLGSDVYRQTMKEDYRSAINILRRDPKFMSPGSPKMILANQPFFGHYLRQYGIKYRIDLYLREPAQVKDIAKLLYDHRANRFYYLEIGTEKTSPVMMALKQHYDLECYSRLNKVNIARFAFRNARLPHPAAAPLQECP